MPSYNTPKINTEYIFYVSLPSVADTNVFQANPTLAAGDVKVSTDGGTEGNLGTLPVVTPAGSKRVKVTVSAAEMNGDNVQITFSDAAGDEWTDLTVNIQTTANQIDDLATPTNITAGTLTTVTNLTNLPSIPANWITTAGITDGAYTAAKFAENYPTLTELTAEILVGTTAVIVQVDANETKIDTLTTTVGTAGAGLTNIGGSANNWSTHAATDIVSAGAITTLTGAVVNVDLVDTLTTYTGNTLQTGDSFARLGAPAGASVSADVATVDANVDTLLTRITSTLFSGITSLAEWLGLMAGAQVANATALTEIKASGAGSGTYDESTDSLEAIAGAGGGGAPTVIQIRQEMDSNSTQLAAIVADTNELQTNQGNWLTATGFSTFNAATDTVANVTTVATTTTNTDMRGTDSALLASSMPTNWGALAISAGGIVNANLEEISGSTITETSSGRIAGNFNTFWDNADAATTNTVDDVGSGAGGGGVTEAEVTKYFQLLMRSDAAIATDNATQLTAINADGGSGAGDYAPTTESNEAIRDRGDAAWTTGTVSITGPVTIVSPVSADQETLSLWIGDTYNTTTKHGLLSFTVTEDYSLATSVKLVIWKKGDADTVYNTSTAVVASATSITVDHDVDYKSLLTLQDGCPNDSEECAWALIADWSGDLEVIADANGSAYIYDRGVPA